AWRLPKRPSISPARKQGRGCWGDRALTSASPGADRGCHNVPPPGEVVVSMRPVCVFAKGPGEEIERLRADLRGRWRQASRAVMVLLSLHGLPAAQIAGLLECHPATVRRWISRFNSEGPGRAGRPAPVRPSTARREAAGQQDRRAAGTAGAVDAAPDLAVPGLAAGQPAHAIPPGAAGGGAAAGPPGPPPPPPPPPPRAP